MPLTKEARSEDMLTSAGMSRLGINHENLIDVEVWSAKISSAKVIGDSNYIKHL